MADSTIRIPLAEEKLEVETERLVTGRVRVTTRTETFDEVATARLESSEVEVRRVPVGREIDSVPPVRTEGDETVIPILEEIVVVEKRLVLKEELRIRRLTRIEDMEIPVTLRRQRAEIEDIEDPQQD